MNMDAVEYIKQARKKCKWYNGSYGCSGCSLYVRCEIKLFEELAEKLKKNKTWWRNE